MTEAKFTEGPWRIDSFGFVVSENGDFVITPTNDESIAFNTKYDESLVLAAPEMYEMLERFVDSVGSDGLQFLAEEAEGILAKARGT